jgi:hypothetical protein
VGIDTRYGKVITEHDGIPARTPVFVLSAQDSTAQVVLGFHHSICVLVGSPPEYLMGIDAAIKTFAAWQVDNDVHVPQSIRIRENEPEATAPTTPTADIERAADTEPTADTERTARAADTDNDLASPNPLTRAKAAHALATYHTKQAENAREVREVAIRKLKTSAGWEPGRIADELGISRARVYQILGQ